MPRPRFQRVRIPETGAHWSCPVGALDVHGLREHVIDGKPPTVTAERPKSNVPKGGRHTATDQGDPSAGDAQDKAEESADNPEE